MKPIRSVLRVTALAFLLVSGHLSAQTGEQLERWFESDDESPPYTDHSSGERLKWLKPDSAGEAPHIESQLILSAESAQTGWVTVEQCHHNIDPVPSAEVVYSFERMRNLRIREAEKIAEVWVSGQSVQIRHATEGARLCVAMEAKILRLKSPEHFQLHYGPFMRKFLHGYFPLHLTIQVVYPHRRFKLYRVEPPQGPGFLHQLRPGRVHMEAWFSGMLTITVELQGK